MVDGETSKLYLVHWNHEEAEVLAEALAGPGWTVETETEDGARAVERILADPPAAVVIYLTRLPSHGRETARHLRKRSTVPIVFVNGEDEKVNIVRAAVPDAAFVQSGELLEVLKDLGLSA